MRKIDKVLTWLRQWESDKWIHVVAFLLLAWAVGRITAAMVSQHTGILSTAIGAAAAAVLAVGKEWYDKRTESLFDMQDLWASWLGVGLYIMMNVL